MSIGDVEDLAIGEQLSSSFPKLKGEVVPGKGKKFTIEDFERKRPTEKILVEMIDQMSFWHRWFDRPVVRDRRRRRRRGPRTLVAQGYIPKKKTDQSQF